MILAKIKDLLTIAIMLCSLILMVGFSISKYNDRREENTLIEWLSLECANELKKTTLTAGQEIITMTKVVNSISTPHEIKVKVITECSDKYMKLP
ncbi:hypothetical protein [Sulfurospirillum sp.]|uniref:hypothetical protein n=1 Tax=Sulfurospirillum sp. TaxID=2053622 RepID=UPI002FDDE031